MENWIKKAFEKASDDSEDFIIAEDMTEKFLDQHFAHLLEMYLSFLPDKTIKKFVKRFIKDMDVSLAIKDLCGSFFLTGFLAGKKYQEDKE